MRKVKLPKTRAQNFLILCLMKYNHDLKPSLHTAFVDRLQASTEDSIWQILCCLSWKFRYTEGLFGNFNTFIYANPRNYSLRLQKIAQMTCLCKLWKWLFLVQNDTPDLVCLCFETCLSSGFSNISKWLHK